MKKLIVFLMAMIMITPAFALGFPVTLGGHITGYSTGNLDMTVQNMRTGVSAQIHTNPYGDYLINWLDYGQTNYGDQFKVTINYCSSDDICTKTVEYLDEGSMTVNFANLPNQCAPQKVWTAEDCKAVFGLETIHSCDVDYTAYGVFAILVILASGYGAYKGLFRFQIREQYLNAKGKNAYRWKTVLEKKAKSNVIQPVPTDDGVN